MVRSDAHFDYVTVGHVTCDVIEQAPQGGAHDTVRQPGGGAFYSALQAARLGLRTLILTQGVPSEIHALLDPYLDELELKVIPAEHTTALATSVAGPTRTQRMLSWAGPIVESIQLDAKVLHLAPIALETPAAWQSRPDFIGVTPQGLVRRWRPTDRVSLLQLDTASLLGDIPFAPPDDSPLPGEISLAPLEPAQLPDSFDAAVISEAECPSCQALFPAARNCEALVAVTAGARPTTVHLPIHTTGAGIVQTAIPPALTVGDDLGAGDVFAAAFFIALSEDQTPLEAATFANAAAAVRITGIGPDAIGGRAEIERVLRADRTSSPPPG